MNYLVSIVMPVFNSKDVINDTINSILEQTYSNFELLCINDCSDDGTDKILKIIQEKDSRVKVYSFEKKQGAAAARNYGLSKCGGDYVLFLDSDDIFYPNMVERLLATIAKDDCDMCICEFDIFDNKTGQVISRFSPKQVSGVTDRVFNVSELGDDGLLFWNTAAFNKIYLHRFLTDNKIEFQNLTSANDVYFSIMCSLQAQKISYVKEVGALVKYRTNRDKQISANKDIMNIWRAYTYLLEQTKNYITPKQYVQLICSLIIIGLEEIKSQDTEASKKLYKKIREFLRRENIVVDDFWINNIKKNYIELSYENNWFLLRGKYEEEIRLYFKSYIENYIGNCDITIIWGNGKRAEALQKILQEFGYANIYITDKKNIDIGNYTKYGYKIISTDEAMTLGKPIISSNKKIYDELVYFGIESLCLEAFCL